VRLPFHSTTILLDTMSMTKEIMTLLFILVKPLLIISITGVFSWSSPKLIVQSSTPLLKEVVTFFIGLGPVSSLIYKI
jgi:hypothetical protein